MSCLGGRPRVKPSQIAARTVRNFDLCGRGGIGRRSRFRSCRRKVWGFESLRPHQKRPMRLEKFAGSPVFRSNTWKPPVLLGSSLLHRRARQGFVRFGRPNPRPDRPERRRQDHAVQLLLAALHAGRGRHRVRGPLASSTARRTASPSIGIGRTFQNLALFRTMSVLDNVRVGGHPLGRSDFFGNALQLPWDAARGAGARRRSPGS